MRVALLAVVVACGGAGPGVSEAPRPQVTCSNVIRPMIERRVSASISEIARRERLDPAEHERLDRLARQRAERLSTSMIASCSNDHWSQTALTCFDRARSDRDMQQCNGHLSVLQREHVMASTGM